MSKFAVLDQAYYFVIRRPLFQFLIGNTQSSTLVCLLIENCPPPTNGNLEFQPSIGYAVQTATPDTSTAVRRSTSALWSWARRDLLWGRRWLLETPATLRYSWSNLWFFVRSNLWVHIGVPKILDFILVDRTHSECIKLIICHAIRAQNLMILEHIISECIKLMICA